MALEFSLRTVLCYWSIKSNMGHLTRSSRSCRIDKTILAMNHKMLPPSLGFEKLNPHDFENSPFL
jgi:acyl transferase domain-containing protein